jgi:hypothetical protein
LEVFDALDDIEEVLEGDIFADALIFGEPLELLLFLSW